MSRGWLWLRIVLRVLLSVLFVFSALAKLFGIDQFELYVYSFGFFPLDVCFVLARLCIGVELAIGVLIAIGWFARTVRLFTLLVLLFFTFFLCYAALVGRSDSCQCFGQMLDLSPTVSLLKNAVLMALVLLYYRLHFSYSKSCICSRLWRMVVACVVVLAAVAVPFIISVPDSWMFGRSNEVYNQAALKEAISADGALAYAQAGEERRVLAFVTPGCPYCRMARQKLGSIADRNLLDTADFLFVEPADISDSLFLQITYGARPIVLLLDSGRVVATYHYRNIDEREIAAFLRSEE